MLVICRYLSDTVKDICRCFTMLMCTTMLVDTHIHIPLMITMNSLQLSVEESAAIRVLLEEAHQHGVDYLVTIATTWHDSMQNIEIAQKFPAVYATIGIHPTEIDDSTRVHIVEFGKLLTQQNERERSIVAIGECGVDRYHKHATVIQQQDVFRMQIELALCHDMPIVIHSREAVEETLYCLDEFKDTHLRGIVHCFSYDTSSAREFIERGFVLGIGGTVTYPKNDSLRTTMREISLHDFVLETDAPFLPPQPWRGKKNHPQYIAYLAEYIAELRNVTPDVIAQATTHTAQKIFKIIS